MPRYSIISSTGIITRSNYACRDIIYQRLKGKWLLSTYENPLYDRELKATEKLEVEAVKWSGYDRSSEERRRPEPQILRPSNPAS
ncbi:MAG: hypothetical protein L2C94_000755 [Aigarchaeota archaeon]|nr:hypothetical protein [Candidatus Wolframiiraptor gerlachensis]